MPFSKLQAAIEDENWGSSSSFIFFFTSIQERIVCGYYESIIKATEFDTRWGPPEDAIKATLKDYKAKCSKSNGSEDVVPMEKAANA
ncbi:hypothetical protein BUALT_Bualt02G0115100 [Buddleja alternifolia]|uniref:Uncharacterized protein n=1 Tax=Buddleja alternifolia TaxID=168488 RepID=A0AAV6Y656_9LAMI|nr:hypothetical protein BUALT_Bualt02G0115100 [Buddleja alternifolia]